MRDIEPSLLFVMDGEVARLLSILNFSFATRTMSANMNMRLADKTIRRTEFSFVRILFRLDREYKPQ
jgi:hypothetical protein